MRGDRPHPGRGQRAIYRRVEDKALEAVRVGGRVRLGDDGAVARAIQRDPVHAQPLPDGLEVLDHLDGPIAMEVDVVRVGLADAAGDERPGGGGRDRAGVVGARCARTVTTVGEPDPAGVERHDVERVRDPRRQRVEHPDPVVEPAGPGTTGGDDEHAARCGPAARRLVDGVGHVDRLLARRVEVVHRDADGGARPAGAQDAVVGGPGRVAAHRREADPDDDDHDHRERDPAATIAAPRDGRGRRIAERRKG